MKRLLLKKYTLNLGIIICVGILGFILAKTIPVGYSMPWTGFGIYTMPNGDVMREKTLWDWMQLLIVPVFLAGTLFFLNRSERNTEREIATDRQQEAALQTYLDRMADLLLKGDLRTTNAEARNVARIRTLTLLRELDFSRKGLVLLFLCEAKLIDKENCIVDLTGADLKYTELFGADLSGIKLEMVDLKYSRLVYCNLKNAHLNFTSLRGTDLRSADLQYVSLNHADLRNASLLSADLTGANIQSANMQKANLRLANLDGVNLKSALLKDAIMPDGTKYK